MTKILTSKDHHALRGMLEEYGVGPILLRLVAMAEIRADGVHTWGNSEELWRLQAAALRAALKAIERLTK